MTRLCDTERANEKAPREAARVENRQRTSPKTPSEDSGGARRLPGVPQYSGNGDAPVGVPEGLL